jgi:uncharacterized membrane protein YfhO
MSAEKKYTILNALEFSSKKKYNFLMRTVGIKFKASHVLQDLACFALTFLILLLVSCVLRITPFGDNTFLYDDMKRQYVDFYSYYRQIFYSSNDFLYSFSKGIGGGMAGFSAYYLTSPLLLFFIFVPRNLLPQAVTFLILTKASLSALTCNLLLRWYCGKNSSRSMVCTIPFAVSYSLSAWMIANAANTMWIDAVILMPLLFRNALPLAETAAAPDRKRRLFCLTAVCTAGILYLNFYIAYMILLFLFLWMILRVLLKKADLSSFFRWLCAVALGAGLAAFLLIPAFCEIRLSNKSMGNGNLLHRLFTPPLFADPQQILAKLFSFSFDASQIMDGMPALYAGVLILLLTGLFFTSRASDRSRKIELGSLLGILFVSFWFQPLNLLWHAGSVPLGYLYRYSFLFTFLLILCACSSFLQEDTIRPSFLFGTACIFVLLFFVQVPFLHRTGKIVNLLLAASEMILWVVFTNLHCRGSADTGSGSGKFSLWKHLSWAAGALLLILQCLDLTANAAYVIHTESRLMTGVTEFRSKVNAEAKLADSVKSSDPGFYRIGNLTPREQNDSMQFAYNGITHYSSEDSLDVRRFLRRLGFDYNGLYSSYGSSNTRTADSILGVKYVLSHDKVRKNETAFPIAVGLPSVSSDVADTSIKDTGDPFRFQQEIAASMAAAAQTDKSSIGQETDTAEPLYDFTPGDEAFPSKNQMLFVPASILTETQETDPADPGHTVSETLELQAEYDGELFFYLDGLKNPMQNMTVSCNGGIPVPYGNAPDTNVLHLGHFRNGDILHFVITIADEDPADCDFGKAVFVSENRDVLRQAASLLQKRAGTIEKISSSHLQISLPSDSQSVLLAIPYDKGWTASIGRTRMQAEKRYGIYTLLSLPSKASRLNAASVEGTSSADQSNADSRIVIDYRYIPQGLYAGIVISVLSLLALFLILRPRTVKPDTGILPKCL